MMSRAAAPRGDSTPVDSRLSESSRPLAGRRARADGAVLLLFLALSAVFHRWYAQERDSAVFLSGDAANIACMAAALEHPERFQGDSLFGDPANLAFYTAVQVQILRRLVKDPADYGRVTDLSLGLHVFVYLAGWYLLGILLLRSRRWAALWALLGFAFISVNMGEFWGPFPDVLPRCSFQAVLPYLLVMVLWLAPRSPVWWPLIGFLAGATVWLHPVSAPAWCVAVWSSLWPVRVEGLDRRGRAVWLAVTAVTMCLPLLPCAAVYLQQKQHLPTVHQDLLLQIMEQRLGRSQLSVVYALCAFAWYTLRAGLLPFAMLGGLGLWRWGRSPALQPCDRHLMRVAGTWLLAVLATSLLPPALDQAVVRFTQRTPLQFDLIRGLRYLIPAMYLAVLWPLALQARHDANRRRARWIPRWATLLCGVWLVVHSPYRFDWLNADPALRDLLRHVQAELPARGTILPFRVSSLPIRYRALHPVVYGHKDGGILSYVDHDQLLRWQESQVRYEALSALPPGRRRLAGVAALARDLGADYVVMPRALAEEDLAGLPVHLEFRNSGYVVLQMAAKVGDAGLRAGAVSGTALSQDAARLKRHGRRPMSDSSAGPRWPGVDPAAAGASG